MRYGNRSRWKGRKQCRGYYLVTLIGLMVLLAVFSLLATRVFVNQVHLIQGSKTALNNSLKAEGLLRCLRKDVWNAQTITVNETKTGIEIAALNENLEQVTIRWNTNAEGIIVREVKEPKEGDSGERRWKLPATFHFKQSGVVLKMEIAEIQEHTVSDPQYNTLLPKPQTTEIPMVSQIMVWRHDHE